MERIHRYFDRRCQTKSLNIAILQFFTFSVCLVFSDWIITRSSSKGDAVELCVGITYAVLCLLGIFVGFQSIHAVARRLIAESRKVS
jgi:hypothetical protein